MPELTTSRLYQWASALTEFMLSRQIGLQPKGRFPTRLAAVIYFVGLYGEANRGW